MRFNLQPTLQQIPSKKLIGHSLNMSLSENKTGALFGGFMPKRATIKNTMSANIFCVKYYPPDYFSNFSPAKPFTQCALMEVSDFTEVPEGMETFELPEGLYAVFHYKGLNTDFSIFDYIFREWLPNSEYTLDHRPHLDLIGAKYKNNDPESEEDLYIPVKKK